MNQENGHFIFHLRISLECLWACLLNHTRNTNDALIGLCENNHEMKGREYGDRAINALSVRNAIL